MKNQYSKNFVIYDDEPGFWKLNAVIEGLVPAVFTFGILTWDRPNGEVVDLEESQIHINKLKKNLNENFHSYRQIGDRPSDFASLFFINNISEKDLVDLGKEGQQLSVIFGKMTENSIDFSLINCATRQQIGFKRYICEDCTEQNAKIETERFRIPYFDDESVLMVLSERNIYYEKDFPEETIRFLEKDNPFNFYKILEDNIIGKSKYNKRGHTFTKLREGIAQNKKKIINESKWSGFFQTIIDLVPTVHTFGIISWESPEFDLLTDESNKELNGYLKANLNKWMHSYRQIAWEYKNIRNPYIIYNISVKDLIKQALDGSRDFVIFGEIKQNGLEAYLLFIDEKIKLAAETSVYWQSKSSLNEYSSLAELKLPFVGDEHPEIIAENNIFHQKDIPKDVLTFLEDDELYQIKRVLEDDRHPKSKYLTRGAIFNKLKSVTKKPRH